MLEDEDLVQRAVDTVYALTSVRGCVFKRRLFQRAFSLGIVPVIVHEALWQLQQSCMLRVDGNVVSVI